MEINFDSKDELIVQLQKLKTDPAYLYLVKNIEQWKNQCLNELLKPGENEAVKGEFTAYGRVLNFIGFAIMDLTEHRGDAVNLDPMVAPKKRKKE